MKGILSLVISLIISLMVAGPATAQLEEYSGFPKNVGAAVQADIVVTSLENNTQNDIIVLPDNRRVYIYRPDGTVRWDRTAGWNLSDYARTPAVLDINGDNNKEIIMYGNPGHCCAHLYSWDSQGNLTQDIPIGSNIILSPPQVADIGEKIILVGASQGTPAPASGATGIYAFNSSGGQLWYSPIGPVNRSASIAIGNLDDEAGDEAAAIVYNNGAYRLAVLKLNNAGTATLWIRDSSRKISGAVIDDINNDGKNEVVIGSGDGIHIWDRAGVLLWSNSAPVATHSSPAVGDIDGDGIKEVVIGSDQQKQLFAIKNGSMMPGFPVPTEQSVWSRPALADINGDGKLEIIAGDFAGYLYGWDYKGNALDGFPIQPTTGAFMSAPVITDLTGTGSLQIIAGSDDGNIYAFTYSNRQKDTTPPVTTDNADGLWHNSSVTVTLTAVDPESGVAATYYTTDGSDPTTGSAQGNTIILSEDGVYTVKYFSVDNAGNVEPIRTQTVNLDRTPPAISGAALAPPNASGWYNMNVKISFTVSDALSGVNTITPETEVSTEGAEQSVTGTATDRAGNSASFTVSGINIDKTPPDISGAATIRPNANGWYNNDVVVKFNAIDTLSGIDTITPDITISAEDASQSVTGIAVDKAGNTASFTVGGINIDKTQPATESSLAGTSGSNNWYISDVTVTLSATDAISGVSATYYSIDGGDYQNGTSFTVTGEGKHNISYYSTDNAGNAEVHREQAINIDWTSPSTSDNADGAWHNSNVTVRITATDNLADLNYTYYRVTSGTMTWIEKLFFWLTNALGLAGSDPLQGENISITDEGIFDIHYYSIDNAGNKEEEKTSRQQVKIDKTLPSMTVNIPESRTYLHSDTITLDFSAQDALSGIKSINSTIDDNRSVSDGQSLNMLELSFGEHMFNIEAQDNASNLNGQKVSFSVIATIDSLIALNDRAIRDGWINNTSLANDLKSKLNSAKQNINTGKNSTAKTILQTYINNIEAESGKGITPEGAGILIPEARYVIDHLIGVSATKNK